MESAAAVMLSAFALAVPMTHAPAPGDGGSRPEARVFASAGDPMVITRIERADGEFELESLTLSAKNVSNEPIYFVQVVVLLPDAKDLPSGLPWYFLPSYGRPALMLGHDVPLLDDRPIMPGESVELTVSATEYSWYRDYFLNRDGVLPTITRYHVTIVNATFGGRKSFNASLADRLDEQGHKLPAGADGSLHSGNR
jgi:hypothetical protein